MRSREILALQKEIAELETEEQATTVPKISLIIKPQLCKKYEADSDLIIIRKYLNWVKIVEATFRASPSYFTTELSKADYVYSLMSEPLIEK